MKPKIKPIRDLYFRFIEGTEFERQVEPQDLAVALHLEGRIDLIGHGANPTIEHYRDTENFDALEVGDQNMLVYRLMHTLKDGEL